AEEVEEYTEPEEVAEEAEAEEVAEEEQQEELEQVTDTTTQPQSEPTEEQVTEASAEEESAPSETVKVNKPEDLEAEEDTEEETDEEYSESEDSAVVSMVDDIEDDEPVEIINDIDEDYGEEDSEPEEVADDTTVVTEQVVPTSVETMQVSSVVSEQVATSEQKEPEASSVTKPVVQSQPAVTEPVAQPQQTVVGKVVAVSAEKQTATQPQNVVIQEPSNNEDIEKKLEERLTAFEEKLLAKLMAQIGAVNAVNQQVVAPEPTTTEATEKPQEDVFDINDYKGKVIVFEPLDKVKQATWEDVVRRKGHYTYHVTAAANGGWFIKRAKSANPYVYAEDKEEAMQIAILYAKREKAELKIHDKKGVIEKSMSFGREKKIN
ncbi:MAG: DUF2188 domain-containing protein, partial [Christensenellales bacterium]